jgi:hypothetical protein
LNDRVISSPIAGALPRFVPAGDGFHFETAKVFVSGEFKAIPFAIQRFMN